MLNSKNSLENIFIIQIKYISLQIIKTKTIKYMEEKKKLLPWSYLVLYAKHWINFPEFDNVEVSEESFYKELKYILYMCGYMPATKHDCVYLVSKAADELKKFYLDNGKKGLTYGLNNLFEIVMGIEEWQGYFRNQNIDYKTALIYHILSGLSMLNIQDFAVGHIDYVKHECTIGGDWKDKTYEECQENFEKSFKYNLTEDSYKEEHNIIDNFKEYIK